MKAFMLGIASAFFFASTFVLNRAMDLQGGHWIWSASLRYLFMLPPLILLVALRGNLPGLLAAMRARPLLWLGWSTVGFGLFYAPLCFAAAFEPGWLVASTWQLTIVAGALVAPFLLRGGGARTSIPLGGLLVSCVILAGVAIVQLQEAGGLGLRDLALGVAPVMLAAVAYPLGNRAMMLAYGGSLDTIQRVLGMTLASLPFWLALSAWGLATAGAPSASQVGQVLLVALLSGVIATLLFFKATDLARGDARHLAAVEATQAGEVVFALIGEVVLLHARPPTPLSAWP